MSSLQKVQLKLEETALEKLKMNASIDKMNLSEMQVLEEKIRDVKRLKQEEHTYDGERTRKMSLSTTNLRREPWELFESKYNK